MRHQEVIFDVDGQAIYLDPPEFVRGSDPSATVHLMGYGDDSAAESATTGTASLGSVDTTLDAAAPPGTTSLTLDSGTGVARGRRYLITSTIGLAEHVDVLAVSGVSVLLQRPLVNDYATGSTFQDTRISISIDNAWAADKTNLSDVADTYRVRWTYTAGGSPQVAVTYFDLVRYPARSLVTGQDVDNRFPGWIDRLPPDHRDNQGASLIDSALDAIRLDAMGDAQVLHRMRDTQVLRELVICKSNLLAIENQVYAGSSGADRLQVAQDMYMQRYQQLVREPKVPVDDTGDGAASAPADRTPVWRR